MNRNPLRSWLLALLFIVSSAHAQDDFRQALSDARLLREQGHFEAALERHVWFHEKVPTEAPQYRGVRLSFALNDWVELGQKYPKALEKLKSIRDAAAEKLTKGTGDRLQFLEVASINRHLGESQATVALFKQLDGSNQALAREAYDSAEDSLLEAHEYALAKRYLGPPAERLAVARRTFEADMEWLRSRSKPEQMKKAHEEIFADSVVGVLTILKETGDQEVAKSLQAEALKTLDHPRIKSALAP